MKVMASFLSDWWEAFVISKCYEMGDPPAPNEVRGTGRGEARAPVPLQSGIRNALK